MERRNDRAQVLVRLRLMSQDVRRSTKLRAQESDPSRRISVLRGGYRSAARATLQATLAAQAAHMKLAAQAAQPVAAEDQRVAGETPAAERERVRDEPHPER
ncbi:MAG: hypothetical protein HGA45_03860 [Chloroflexales bacterium]|nr:hypothetical protein [Chloroflexales bacterium]